MQSLAGRICGINQFLGCFLINELKWIKDDGGFRHPMNLSNFQDKKSLSEGDMCLKLI